MVACAGLFTACSNEVDEVIDNTPEQGTKADAYLNVSFTMPSSSATRAYADNGEQGTEAGTDAENQITDAYVYLFKDNALAVAKKLEIIPPSTSGDKDRLDSKPFTIETGTYKVYVVTNAEASKTTTNSADLTALPVGTTISTFLEYVNNYNSVANGNYCKANNFLMTNAYTIAENVSGNTDPDGVKSAVEGLVEVSTSNSTEAKAARVNVHVERIAAKITYTAENKSNTFTVVNSANNTVGTLKLTSFKIVNTRNSSFLYRRVKLATDANSDLASVEGSVYGGDEVHSSTFNYVVENQFLQKDAAKSAATAADFYNLDVYQNNYTKRENTYVKWRILPTDGTLSYCMENTMNRSAQLLGLTTRIIFRGIFTLDEKMISEDAWTKASDGEVADFSSRATFYRYGSKYYRTITQILIDRYSQTNDEDGAVAALNRAFTDNYLEIQTKISKSYQKEAWEALGENATPLAKAIILKSAFEDAVYTQTYLYNNSIDQYVDGYCYYNYQIRHRGDNSAINGLMEFAVVRNNVYKLNLKAIQNVGDFTSNTPGTGTEQPGDEDGTDPNNPNPENPCEPDPNGPNPTEPTTPIAPKPIVPDEQVESWLNVEINVLKWVIRNNDIIL